MRLLGAHPAAEVATRTRIVDVQIAHAFIGKEAPNCIFKFASIDDIRTNHHGRCVISTN